MNATLVETIGREPVLAPPRDRRRAGAAFLTERPLSVTCLLAFVGALLLQFWRPFFFLTCDTLSASLPISTEAYRRLWEGHSPFYNPYLFGGYDLLSDSTHFVLWSPLALPFSFLARTAYYFLLPDIVGTLSLAVIAGAFCWSALRLKRALDLPIPPALIVALSLSYAFTPYNFLVGASWIGFLNIQAAYPLVLAGAFERNWRQALAIQAAALLYAIFGGHMHLTTMLVLFGGLTILLAAGVQRSMRPILVWAGAGLLTLLLILPLLWPSLVGFSQSGRNAALSVAEASGFNVPLPKLAASFLLGPMCQGMVGDGIHIDQSDPLYNSAIAFALVNLPLVGLLAWKRRWNVLELGLAGLALCVAVCIVRPVWLAQIFSHLPLLRSLRWPFREIVVLSFLTHALFLVGFRPPTARGARMTALACGAAGALSLACVFLCAAPTFWLFEPDRRLIISGEADRYWNQLKERHGVALGEPRFAVQAQPEALMPRRRAVPFSLLGGFNYASLFRISNVTGFSTVAPRNARWLENELGVQPWFWGGVYSEGAVDRITAAHPDVQRIVLTGMLPMTWRVFEGTPHAEEFHIEWPAGRIARHPSVVPSPVPTNASQP
jgi:hypothetical protein